MMHELGTRHRVSTITVISSLCLLLPLAASCGSTVDGDVLGTPTGVTTGVGGGSSSGGGGDSGVGGASQGCMPGTLLECYSGPKGTEGVGVCHGGAKKCADDGVTFGPCQWEVTPAAEDCATKDDEDCDGATPACPGQTVWSESFEGAGNEFIQRLANDPAGNLIVVGGFDGTFDIAGVTLTTVGVTDIFVAKFDSAGTPLWAKSFGSVGDDYSVDVAADGQGNIVVTGAVAGNVDFGDGPLAGFGGDDIFILKLDPQGKLIWRKMLGSAMDEIGYGVTADKDGNVLATGSFSGTIDFGAGGLTAKGTSDLYIAKYDPAGAAVWVKKFGGMYQDYGTDITALPGGEVLVTGGFYGPVDFGTGQLVTIGSYDGFVAKFDSAGKAAWVTQLKGQPGGMADYPVTYGVAADPTGAAVVTGFMKGKVDFGGGVLTCAGGTDAFLAKYDGATGKHVFSERFGGAYVNPNQPDNVTDAGFAVATDAAGNILLTGTYIDTIDLGGGLLGKQPYGDVYYARFDPFGKHIVSKNYGTAASYATGSGVVATKSGDAVLAGYFVGTIDFGKGPLATATGQDTDIYLAEIAP